MQEDVGRYQNPFLLPPKKKQPEKVIRSEELQKVKHLSPEQLKQKKTARFGLIITVILFILGGLVSALPYLTPKTVCGNGLCEKNEVTSCPADCSPGESVEKTSSFSQPFIPSDENEPAQPSPAQPPATHDREYDCNDNLDNDYDGNYDCDDSDCQYSEYCTAPSLYVFDFDLKSPLQTSPAFVSPGQNLTIKFAFTVDLNPITSNLLVRDVRIGNQQCGRVGAPYYNTTESLWNVICTLPSNMMGLQHLFLQVESPDFNETRVDVEFLAVIFPAKSLIYNVAMNSPTSKITLAAGNTFNMSCRATTSNMTGINLLFQYRGNDFAIKDIETSGSVNLTISLPNPETNILNATTYRHIVTAHTNGTYFVRCKADNGTFSMDSGFVEINVSTDVDNPPSEVSDLHVSRSGNSWIYFIWDAATDDYGIQYYVLFKDGEHIANTTSLDYNLTSLAQSASYNFSVVAFDTGGNYGLPTTLEASTLGDTPPSAASNLQAQSSGSDWIYFTWDTATDDTGIGKYILSLDSVNIANTTDLFFNSTGLAANTTYDFAVKAVDLSGKVGPETSIQAATQVEGFGVGSVKLKSKSWLNSLFSLTGKLVYFFRHV